MPRTERSDGGVVLITTPSLDRSINVSGVSSVVRGILRQMEGSPWRHVPVIIGRRDGTLAGFLWLFSQISVPLRLVAEVLRHRPNVLHVNGPLGSLAILRDAVLVAVGRLMSVPVLYHLHGGPYLAVRPSNALLRAAVSFSLAMSTRVVTLGQKEAEFLSAVYGMRTDRAVVLPNAVCVKEQIAVKEDTGHLRVLSFGRLTVEKGIEVICEALESGDEPQVDCELRLFGVGPLEDAVVPRLQAALGDAFHFGGVADSRQLRDALEWADVMLIPSLWGEGLPMALLEAMAHGVVPIATDDGMITEVVHVGENGYIIEKNSAMALRTALLRALSDKHNNGLARYSTAAHKLVQNRHSMQAYGTALDAIYAELV